MFERRPECQKFLKTKIYLSAVKLSLEMSAAAIGTNVPTLGAVGDFGKLNCLPARIYNRSRNLQ